MLNLRIAYVVQILIHQSCNTYCLGSRKNVSESSSCFAVLPSHVCPDDLSPLALASTGRLQLVEMIRD